MADNATKTDNAVKTDDAVKRIGAVQRGDALNRDDAMKSDDAMKKDDAAKAVIVTGAAQGIGQAITLLHRCSARHKQRFQSPLTDFRK